MEQRSGTTDKYGNDRSLDRKADDWLRRHGVRRAYSPRRVSRPAPFSRLRADARHGNWFARTRLAQHVQRRLARGWKIEHIADRLGLNVAEAHRYAVMELLDQTRPRLVRSPM